MREIKFRAWHESGKMFFVGDEYHTSHPLDCCMYAMQGQPVTLEQFTGLRDANGVEIYEGDIVESQLEQKYIVEWVDVGWGPFCTDGKKHYKVSIIGNIHETPELIK